MMMSFSSRLGKQLLDGEINRLAGWHHQPDDARQTHLLDKVGQRMRAERAFVDASLDRLRATVVCNQLVAAS